MDRERPCVICRTPTRALVRLSEPPRRSFLCSLLSRRIYLESRSPEPLLPAAPPPALQVPAEPRAARRRRASTRG